MSTYIFKDEEYQTEKQFIGQLKALTEHYRAFNFRIRMLDTALRNNADQKKFKLDLTMDESNRLSRAFGCEIGNSDEAIALKLQELSNTLMAFEYNEIIDKYQELERVYDEQLLGEKKLMTTDAASREKDIWPSILSITKFLNTQETRDVLKNLGVFGDFLIGEHHLRQVRQLEKTLNGQKITSSIYEILQVICMLTPREKSHIVELIKILDTDKQIDSLVKKDILSTEELKKSKYYKKQKRRFNNSNINIDAINYREYLLFKFVEILITRLEIRDALGKECSNEDNQQAPKNIGRRFSTLTQRDFDKLDESEESEESEASETSEASEASEASEETVSDEVNANKLQKPKEPEALKKTVPDEVNANKLQKSEEPEVSDKVNANKLQKLHRKKNMAKFGAASAYLPPLVTATAIVVQAIYFPPLAPVALAAALSFLAAITIVALVSSSAMGFFGGSAAGEIENYENEGLNQKAMKI